MKPGADTMSLSTSRKVVLRVAKEGALLGWLAVCLYLLLAMLNFDPQDPGWSTTGRGGSTHAADTRKAGNKHHGY